MTSSPQGQTARPGRLSPGDTLGKYRLERLLGAGGMGEVWAAHDPDLDRRVALKVLRRELASDDGARARLQREGRAMARLRHPNVITVHEAVFRDGRGVIAMELVDGESLAAWLARKPARAAIVPALLAAGRGLAAAHAAGMVHRDFKPHNVLVDRDGRIVVTDFGLARATEPLASAAHDPIVAPPIRADDDTLASADAVESADTAASPQRTPATDPTLAPARAPARGDEDTVTPALADTAATALADTAATPSGARVASGSDAGALHSPLTLTGELLGTPAYMAPEQLTGREVDERSDQFAFCVTAWEALTGARPFRGANLAELTDHVLHRPPAQAEAVPARLRSILERGLAREPGDRWPSMTAVLAAIDRAWRRPRRIAQAATAVAVAAALITTGVMLRRTTAASPCVAPDVALASVWSPAIRARVAEHLGPSAQADAVVGFFDEWRDRWTAIDRATCARPAAPDFAPRRACLDGIRDEIAIWRGAMEGLPRPVMLYLDYPVHIVAPEICQTNPHAIAPTNVAGTDTAAAVALRTEMIVSSVRATLDRDKNVDFAPFVERARALGSNVLVAEALMRQAEVQDLFAADYAAQAVSCATSDAAAAEAERAGHDRYRAMALIQALRCATLIEAPLAERIKLATQLDSAADRLGDRAIRGLADNVAWEVEMASGRWTAAIDRLERARTIWIELRSLQNLVNATVHSAEVRILRHLGDDHAVAIERLKQLVPRLAATTGTHEQTMVGTQLGPLLWMTRDFAAAMPFHKTVKAKAADRVEVQIRVSGDGAAGAEVVAVVEPNLDPTRLSMSEYDGAAASGTTDADGALALSAPVGGVIVARSGTAIAAAPVPATGGRVAIQLAPGQPLSGTVRGFAAIAADEPGRLALAHRRQVPVIYATTAIGGRVLTWHAPVAVADGSWSLPAVPSGRYVIAADLSSALGDDQTAQTIVDVGATAPAPIALELPEPAIVRVIVHPAIAGRVVTVPAGALPHAWPELAARLATAPTLAMTDIGDPLRQEQVGDGAVTGDALADVSVLQRPAVVCVLPDAHSYFSRSLFRVAGGTDKAPPICRELPAGDGPVIVETR